MDGQRSRFEFVLSKALNDTTKNYLEQVNVPTKEDIARVATLVINLENKVDNIEEFLEDR